MMVDRSKLRCEVLPITNRKKAQSLKKTLMKQGHNVEILDNIVIITYQKNVKEAVI